MTKTANIITVPGDEVVKATYYHEYWGGLGDIFNHVYWLSCYKNLSRLKPGETAFVAISSHNPHAKELWLWHPKAEQINIYSFGFHCGFNDKKVKESLKMRTTGCNHPSIPKTEIEFYPAPHDAETLSIAEKLPPYITFSVASAEPGKFVPPPIVLDAAKRTLAAGFAIVLIGKNYQHYSFHNVQPQGNGRQEPRLWQDAMIVDFVDKLTVPGALQVIKGAAGCFTAHSAACMAAYHMKKATFLLYNDHARRTYLPKGPNDKFGGYLHGAGNPGCDNACFDDEYSGERMERWLAGVKGLMK